MSLRLWAETIQSVQLSYRDAIDLQQKISQLVGDDLSVVSDDQRVIVRGEAADVSAIIQLIKRLDIPTPQLLIDVYRGVDPNINYSNKSQRVTTKPNKNQLDQISVQEGETVVISEAELLALPLVDYWRVEKGGAQSFENFLSSQYQFSESGIYITATLIEQEQEKVKVEAQFSYVDKNHKNSTEVIRKQQKTVMILPLNQWVNVVDSKTQFHRPEMDSNRQIFSTETALNRNDNVWIKVTAK